MSHKDFGCVSVEKARGGSRQGDGRPQNEGATLSKVTVFLGHTEEVREQLDEMHHELNQSSQLNNHQAHSEALQVTQ